MRTLIFNFRTCLKANNTTEIRTLSFVIAGIHACFDRNLGSKLFMGFAFDFWDFDQSVVGFFLRNLSIIGLWGVVTHFTLAFIHHWKKKP